jgi:hypothetical protein
MAKADSGSKFISWRCPFVTATDVFHLFSMTCKEMIVPLRDEYRKTNLYCIRSIKLRTGRRTHKMQKDGIPMLALQYMFAIGIENFVCDGG